MRLFIAIAIAPTLQNALALFSQPLKQDLGTSVRWVKPGKFHLTMKFLGEVDQPHYALLQKELKRIASLFAPMELTLQGCGVFPDWKQPRVIWIGIQAPQALNQLANVLENDLQSMGFPIEERPFTAHLTLGRINNWMTSDQKNSLRSKLEAAHHQSFGTMKADHLTLYRSDLRPEGPAYSELLRVELSAPLA
jgi:2'-5' RNA ligase